VAKLELEADETVVLEQKALWLKSKFQGFGGKLLLSDRRLAFAQTGIAGLGLIGLLFNKQGTVKVQIAKGDVAGVTRGKHLRNDKVVEVSTRGGATHRFIVDNQVDEWITTLERWSA
jgi:hypothetical protein